MSNSKKKKSIPMNGKYIVQTTNNEIRYIIKSFTSSLESRFYFSQAYLNYF